MPVIVISAVDTAATATRAMKLGAFDYVTKPYDDTTLIRLVSSAVRAPSVVPDRTDRPAPAWASHGLLLAGHDVPLLAMLKLAVRADCVTALVSTPASALRHLDRFRPAVSLIDDSLNWRDVIGLARAVRRACDDAAIIVGCGPAVPPALLDELSPLRPAALFTKPYDLNDVVQRLRSILPAECRVSIRRRRLSAHIVRAMAYVRRHYAHATLEGAAAASSVSSGYLGHLFPTELGMTFWEYVTATRLEVVKDLLVESSHKLDRIAELVGFSDGPHLSRVFRQSCGRRPGAYRQSP